MEGAAPIIFLAVVLKIPVAMLLYLVWWAFHAEPETEESPPGSDDHRFRRFRPNPRGPKSPRRGPHAPDAQPLPGCPPGGRARILTSPPAVRAATGTAGRHGRGAPERV